MRSRTIVVGLLGAYKRFVSPFLPAACRFHPTCSQYAIGAVETHGLLRGSWLAVLRIARCQPFCRGGFDPVPPSAARATRVPRGWPAGSGPAADE